MTNNAASPVIAEEYRAGVLENAHQGLVCILDGDKNVIYGKGDIDTPVFYRSALKPIQAIPVFTTDTIEKYGLTPAEAALFAASQRGESYHQQHLKSLMGKLRLDEDLLICNQSYPLNVAPKMDYVSKHLPKRKLLHNCAGKHLGFLAYAREKELDIESYHELQHPL